MKKLILFILILTVPIFAQQINYTWGYEQSGTAYDGSGLTYIDTTTGTTNDIYVDISDYYWWDANPLVIDYDMDIGTGADSTLDGTVKNNSDRSVFGTFYVAFDNQGTGSPTTDSLDYTIKVYPGVYTSASKSYSGVDWGTAVTLETIAKAGDYFSINNVYVHATKYKHLPPEVLKFEIAPVGDAACDDSTFVAWRYAYPAIYVTHEERK